MSVERINGEVVFICDVCDDALETETRYFEEANKIRKTCEWMAVLEDGKWLTYCPTCDRDRLKPL